MASVEKLIFARRHRVVLPATGGRGDGAAAARQFDAALMAAGFKCSGELLAVLSGLDAGVVIDLAVEVTGWARELAGDHVRHNTYFIDFPANVPDTVEFWAGLLAESAREFARTGEASVEAGSGPGGEVVINLLSLPGYGRYRHSWEDMLARHGEFTAALSDRVTVLHLGGPLEVEAAALYGELAGSVVPLSGDDLEALRLVAEACIGGPQPEIGVRENRAVINAARVRAGVAPLADTPTDVLRLAAELSGGDVTLRAPVRFGSLPRAQRRVLLETLDGTVSGAGRARLGEVARFAEPWKRLGERLHPHECELAGAREVFAVARGEVAARSVAARAELAFAAGDMRTAVAVLAGSPGMLWRAADRVLRCAGAGDADVVLEQFRGTAGQVSGRVLLSVREHLQNRQARPSVPRVFVNRAGRGWTLPDVRVPVGAGVLAEMLAVIDAEVAGRLPAPGRLLVDPAVLGAALPLSGRAAPAGLGVWPRGSVTPVEGDLLRFFVYWRQAGRRTDFDLSAIFTDEQMNGDDWVSYTSLRNRVAMHSGDITEAAEGASEFVDVDLAKAGLGFVIPQVYVFSGEGFGEVAEGFFGFMSRGRGQGGAPFEPRTVRMKSALAAEGRAVLPLVFFRGEDGRWYAKWLHLELRGRTGVFGGVRVEENKVTAKLLARAMMAREYLRVGYLVRLLEARTTQQPARDDGPVTWIGVDAPDEPLPDGSVVYTLATLGSLIPA